MLHPQERDMDRNHIKYIPSSVPPLPSHGIADILYMCSMSIPVEMHTTLIYLEFTVFSWRYKGTKNIVAQHETRIGVPTRGEETRRAEE